MRSLKDTKLGKALQTMPDGGAPFGELVQLEKAVAKLLSYVPATFPHYTSHTIDHSIEIVDQIGNLVFDAKGEPVPGADLNTTELYILMAAALLHDAGMVTPESEQEAMLADPDWEAWATRHVPDRYAAVRAVLDDPDAEVAAKFSASVDLRRLIAERVRRVHHIRSRSLALGSAPLPDLSLDDPKVSTAIGDVCFGHGINGRDLDDDRRFSLHRDLLGHPVDIRFLAILLRLGDLLDLRHDRACATALWAAGSLPNDSAVHWQQYGEIRHQAVRPDAIEVGADVDEVDVYRLLRDWCSWIVEEVNGAAPLLARSPRHRDWHPPVATMDGDHATITIDPSEGADFVPCEWNLSLDVDQIVDRFVGSIHQDLHAGTVRELVQNAIDANRCRMVAEHPDHDPLQPHKFPREVRAQYPVKVSVWEEEVETDSGTSTERFLEVEDVGIGMAADDITGYLLQVGRSYYATAEFREKYRFSPLNKFGVGFLIAFAISDLIEVDTKPSGGGEGSRIHLTRPSSYIVRRPSLRSGPGTRVRLRLGGDADLGRLVGTVRDLVPFCEIPMEIRSGPEQTMALFDEERSRTYPSIADAELSERSQAVVGQRIDTVTASGYLQVAVRLESGHLAFDKPSDADDISEPVGVLAEAMQRSLGRGIYSSVLDSSLVAIGGLTNASLTSDLSLSDGLRVDLRNPSADLETTLDRRVRNGARLVHDAVQSAVADFIAGCFRRDPDLAHDPALAPRRHDLWRTFRQYPAAAELDLLKGRRAGQDVWASLSELSSEVVFIPVHHRFVVSGWHREMGTHNLPVSVLTVPAWLRGGRGAVEPAADPDLDIAARHPSTSPAPQRFVMALSDLSRCGGDVLDALFEARPVSSVRREGEWWWFGYAPAENLEQSSRSPFRVVKHEHFASFEAARSDVVAVPGVLDAGPGSPMEILPRVSSTSGRTVLLNSDSKLGAWFGAVFKPYVRLPLSRDARTIARALFSDLLSRAVRAGADDLAQLNKLLDEVEADHGEFGWGPPPKLRLAWDSALGLHEVEPR